MTSPRQGLFLPSRSISGELARRGSKSSSLASTNISPSLLSNSFVCILPPMQRPVTDPPALPPPHDEQLFEIFQTFATDGLVHVDQIPTILTLRDEKYSAAEIDRAVHATTLSVGGGGCLLPYDQVLAVWQTLSVPGSEDTTPRCDQKMPVPPSWWPGYGCLRARRQHSLTLGVRSKPTNWLLCVTLVMTVVVAAIITGLATAFLWRFSIEQEIQTLQREMNIVRDAVESIGVRLNEDSHSWKILFATRLMQGNIIGVAYNATANRFLDGVGMAQQVVRGQLEEEWRQLVRQDLTLGVQDTVNWLAALNASAAPLVDALNQQSAARDITLGRWADARRTAITVLSAHNVSGQCADATAWPCGLARHRLALLRGALEASTGSANTTDPALTAPQGYVAAWGRLPDGTALVYALSAAAVQARFAEQQTKATAAGFAALNGTLRVLLTRLDANGTLQVTGPSIPGCPGWESWPPLTRALNETAQQWGVDPCGADEVLVAYGPVPSLGLGLVVYRNASAARAAVTAALAGTFEQLNQDPTREEKLFLVEPNFPRDGCVRCLTPSVCVDECDGDPPNGSAPSVALQIALAPEEGLVTGSDRYGVLYTAGHDRLPALGLCFAVGISEEDTQAEGLRLVLTYIERQNNLTNTSQEILMAKAVAGVRQADIDGPEDFRYLTTLRFSSQCQSPRCGEGLDATSPILRALQGESGVMLGDDYRPVVVISAYTYLPALQAALELKVDASEAEQPSVTVASRLALLCVEAAACCLVALAFIIKAIVAWIEKVWAEGQRAVRDQRQQLLTFLDRMYPASVARDLILTRPRCGGVISFMVAVPYASVVFADIHGFTSTCHRLTAQQLMTFLGYTFSVMDVVASRAGMCRVKLVGDCYMAVAGLPGSADTPCRSAVFFAAWCAQVFSDRYTHPLQNQATMDGLAALACNKGPWPDPWRTDSTTTNEVALGEVKYRPWWNPQAMTLAGHGTPCVLRYGIATGRVTAGVLPGNTPILDVWGKVVTFANQMERLSQPGRVLLCSQTYKSVTGDDVASHAFTFEDGPSLLARPSPSAAATSHFVRSARGLPPCLAAELGLSPIARDAAGPPPPEPTASAEPSSPADDAPLVLLTEASSGT